MSKVLTKIREKYPVYADIPDSELVSAIGTKYPQYLERDKGFADEFDKFVEGPNRTKQAESLGPSAGGSIPVTAEPTDVGRVEQAQSLGATGLNPPSNDSQFGQMVGRHNDVIREKAQDEIAVAIPYQPDVSDTAMNEMALLGPSPGEIVDPAKVLAKSAAKISEAFFDKGLVPVTKLNVTPDQVNDALDMLSSSPVDDMRSSPGGLAKATAGTQQAVNGMLESLTTPFAISTFGVGGVLKTVGARLLSGLFAADMASHAPEQVRQFKSAIQSGDPEAIAKTGVGLGLSGAFIYGAAKHAAEPNSPAKQAGEALLKAMDDPARLDMLEAAANDLALKVSLPPRPLTSADVEGKIIKLDPIAAVAAANGAPATAVAVQQSSEVIKTEKEVSENAETVRSDTGQVRPAGSQPEILQNEGIQNLQQPPPGKSEPVVKGTQTAPSSGPEITKGGGIPETKNQKGEGGLPLTPETAATQVAAEPSFDASLDAYKTTPAADLVGYKGKYVGGATGKSWELGEAAKTPEDVARLKQMAEESATKVKLLVARGDLEGAMAEAGKQPAEAYEFATGVKLDGTPKWEAFEKRVPGYKPSVPDAKWIEAHPEASNINTGALGEAGMGGAKPGEFLPSRQTATGIKNATVDAERQARGQPAIVAPQRLSNPVVWDRVMAKIDTDPGWQDRLVEELKDKPRTPDQDEILALDHRYVDLQNEYAKATRDGARAYEDGYQVGIDEAKTRAAFYEGKLNEIEQIARQVGTEWGRSGQMRQRLLKEDFSLAAMEAKMRAAKGFEPLTDAEHAEIADLQAKIAEKEAASAKAEQEFQERISAAESAKAVAEAKADAAKAPEYEPRVLAVAEKFAKFMDKKGADALARIKARLGNVSAGVDPTILSDVAILGAAKITRGIVDIGKWTDSMARDLGEWFREHAQEAWDESQKSFTTDLSGFQKGSDKSTAEKVKRAVADIPGRISDLTDSIKKKSAEGTGSPVHSEVRKLVKLLVEQNPGITRDELVDTVHGILKESNPDTTRIEAMDAISGRGKFWTPPQDQVSKTVRDLSTQIRLVAHQMDVEAKKPLPRTGYQPEKLSDAARQEQQKLNELKRKYGVVVTNPEAQLGSVLAARKTYYTNRISDLKQEISTRERIVKTKSPSPTDPALEVLKAEYEQVRKEHDEIFGKRELTDEQRLKMAISAAERNEESWNERLAEAKKGNFDIKKEPGRKVTSPELEAIRARTESVKEEVQELKDIATPKKTPDEIALQSLKTRLAREKADLQERLAKGDFSPRRKVRDLPLDSEAAKAKAEVMLLRDKFNAELEKQRYLQKSKAEKIWLGTKEALNLSRAILTSWDVSAVGRQGAFIAIGNPIRAAKSIGPMFQALFSEKQAAAVEAEIQSRPNAKLYEQSKLFLAPRETAKLSSMEEAFMSRLANKIPGVAGSARAYVTFLNKLRADSFDALHDSLTSGGEATPAELKAIANYINVATGRGNLGKAAGAAETLSTAFFAPRLVASRFQLLAGEPIYRGSARTRYLVAKEYGKFLVGLGVIYSLGMMAGGTVEDDPRSSDFGKIKFGHTRIDPLAGLSQTTVLASRLATGELKNFRGKVEPIRGNVEYGHRTAADVIATFLRSKLSPIVGNAVDIATGKNVVGEKVTPGSVAMNMTVPLSFRDIYAVMEEQGIPAGVAIGLLSMFGIGVQNYDERKKR